MTLEKITNQIIGREKTKQERVRILRKNRMQLLAQLDYTIYEIKRGDA